MQLHKLRSQLRGPFFIWSWHLPLFVPMISPKQRASSQAILFWASEGRPALLGAIPCNGVNGEALPRRGTFFSNPVMWKGGDFTSWSIWKGWEICHFSLEIGEGQRGRCILYYLRYVKRLRKYSGFVIIYSYFKDNLQSSQGVHFLSKMVFQRVRGLGWTWGQSLPVYKFVEYHPLPLPVRVGWTLPGKIS